MIKNHMKNKTHLHARPLLLLIGASIFSVIASAQEAAILARQTATPPVEQKATPVTPQQDAVTVNPLFGIGNISEDNYKPLTGQQRWKLFLKEDFTSPGAYLRALGPALGNHLDNIPSEWNQGLKGYSRRVASRYGTFLVQGAVRASAAALLKQDPRYIRSARKGVWPRVGHAILFNYVTFNNDGKKTLAIARIGSAYAGGMTSLMWLPERHTWKDGMRVGHQQLVIGNLSNLVQEFWPEIQGIFKKR
jgi:hypothetical protein